MPAVQDAGDEPVALVMAAQELALVLALPDQEQQVPVGGLNVESSVAVENERPLPS